MNFKIEKYNQYGLPEQKTSTCPLCSKNRKKNTDKCMLLDWDRGLGTCQHCGEVIQLHTYEKKKQVKEYVKPEWKNNTELSDKLVKWFISKRKISQFTLRLMKITEGKEWMPQTKKEENTVQFNYFKNGQLVNIKYRDGAKNFKLFKDAEKIFYNIDKCITSKDIIICEGEMDVLAMVECGLHHSVSVPNGSTKGNVNLDYLDNCIDYFDNKDKVILALDNDEAGQNVSKEIIRRLGSHRCYTIDLKDCKDANEYLVKYGKNELNKVIDNAKVVPLENISSVNDFKDELEEYLLNGFRSGYKIGKQSLDKDFSTYTKQYIVVTGIPSSGKSDFVDEMLLGYIKNYEWKVAVASPENKPNEIHVGKLLGKVCGKWIKTIDDIKTKWYDQAIEYIDNHFKYIDLDVYDLDSVLEKTEELIYRHGIKVLVIDPYNKVRLSRSLSKSITEYTNDYLNTVDEFCRKHDILAIIVAHPRKPELRDAKNFIPTFYDIKGGGEFYDMSPHGLLVHRDYVNDCTMVKVLKCKFAHLGKNNTETWFKWDENSGRYNEFSNKNALNFDDTGYVVVDNSNMFCDKVADEIEIETSDILHDYKNEMKEEIPF